MKLNENSKFLSNLGVFFFQTLLIGLLTLGVFASISLSPERPDGTCAIEILSSHVVLSGNEARNFKNTQDTIGTLIAILVIISTLFIIYLLIFRLIKDNKSSKRLSWIGTSIISLLLIASIVFFYISAYRGQGCG